jgi:hypothetical protein
MHVVPVASPDGHSLPHNSAIAIKYVGESNGNQETEIEI